MQKQKKDDDQRNYRDIFTREEVDQLNALFDAGKTREAARLFNKIKESRDSGETTKENPK